MLELKWAKVLFRSGALKAAYIQHDSVSGGYVVLFDRMLDDNKLKTVFPSQRVEGAKIFKKVESALNLVKSVGFDSVTVCKLQG